MDAFTGFLDFFFGLFQQVVGLPPAILVIFFVLFVYVVFRLFRVVGKAAVVGVIAAMFPLFLGYMGFAFTADTLTVVSFGVAGFIGYIIFSSVMSLFKTGRSVVKLGLRFAGQGGKPKQKVIIKERVVEKKGKNK